MRPVGPTYTQCRYTNALEGLIRLAIRKWGNSLALRIPRGVAHDVQFADGTEVDLTVEAGQVVLTPAAPVLSLGALLRAITDKNLPGEVSTGGRMGREAW